MNIQSLKESIDGIDIYLLDQILKNRYQQSEKILDAGCGNGRNLKWFYAAGFQVHGIDINLDDIDSCKEMYPAQQENFIQGSVDLNPYESNFFNHVICNAVLHFATDLSQYSIMFDELLRVLKPQGSLFIRMASNFGIEKQVKLVGEGVYTLPDGSTRFLLTQEILASMQHNKGISVSENIKTTIVHEQRSMTTIVIKKEG